MESTFITRSAKFLPNSPISNNEMEEYLGTINGIPSKGRQLTLRNNGIKTRYYALDKSGHSTHSNAEMTALAIQKLSCENFKTEDIQLLACGTASPDNHMPSHAVMVHGELESCKPLELISPSGSCCASMQALKAAHLSVISGNTTNAVVTGSEKLSSFMLAPNFENETRHLADLEKNPMIAFEKDFLRWMLSDGAAALLLENKPRANAVNLKIEWLEIRSYANQLETCMYVGADKNEDGSVEGWREFSPEKWLQKSIFAFKQDTKLLGREIVPTGTKYLKEIIEKRGFDITTIDFFLPHLSSEFFRARIAEEIKKYGISIPQEKWFTNLATTGNIGSASILIMLEELMNSGRLRANQKILLMVPESARFTYAYCLLSVC
jgi:3-oxoacyl-[acyl-carrier-protein] synthase III